MIIWYYEWTILVSNMGLYQIHTVDMCLCYRKICVLFVFFCVLGTLHEKPRNRSWCTPPTTKRPHQFRRKRNLYSRAELTPCRHENSKKVADVPQSPIFLFSTVLERSRQALSIHLHFVSIEIVRRKLFKENWILKFRAKIHKVDHMAAMIEASNL